MEQRDMIRACTNGDVLMSTDQKAEVCASGVCLLQHAAANKGIVSLKMFCFFCIEAGVFKKADEMHINLTGPRLEGCVHAAI